MSTNSTENNAPHKQGHSVLFKKNDCFSGQRKNEIVEAVLIRHGVVLIPIILVTFFAASILFGINSGIRYLIPEELKQIRTITILFDFFYLTLLTHYFFISILNYYLHLVIITNLRIIDVKYSTLFKRNIDTLELENIQDINITKKGFWRWLLNFGRITMHNAAGTELFDFKFLKNPIKNYNIINHVHFKLVNKQNETQMENVSLQNDEN